MLFRIGEWVDPVGKKIAGSRFARIRTTTAAIYFVS